MVQGSQQRGSRILGFFWVPAPQATPAPKAATLIVVTHKLRLLSLVERVIVMTNGRPVLDGPVADVLKALQGSPKQEAKA